MNCGVANEKIVELIYGELTEEDRADVLRHIDECSQCRSEVETLRKSQRHLELVAADLDSTTSLPDGHVRVLAGSVLRQEKNRRRWRRVAWCAACAAVLLLAAHLISLRCEIHQTHLVIGWGTNQRATEPEDERLRNSLREHEDHLHDVDRLMALVVRTLDTEGSRIDRDLVSLRTQLAAVERRGDTRWRTVSRILPSIADNVVAIQPQE